MNNELLKNKHLYKTFITSIKYTPIVLSTIHLVSLTLNYFGISSLFLSSFGGTSLLLIILLFIISYVFRFCYLYRIPLWYSTIMIAMFTLRLYGLIPIDLENLYRLYALISGLFISLFIYYKYKNRNKPKVDPIKNLCERYCNCK